MPLIQQTVEVGENANTTATWSRWKGSREPDLLVQFVSADEGAAEDMSGDAGVPKISLKFEDTGQWLTGTEALYGGNDMTAVDATTGKYTYAVPAADVGTVGTLNVYFDRQRVSGIYERVPSPGGGIQLVVSDVESA